MILGLVVFNWKVTLAAPVLHQWPQAFIDRNNAEAEMITNIIP